MCSTLAAYELTVRCLAECCGMFMAKMDMQPCLSTTFDMLAYS